MIFLLALALATAASAAVMGYRRRFSPRDAARSGMAIALAFAGASHLFLATPFVQHLPSWVPLRSEIVLVSGLVEIALAIALLLPPPTRRRVGVVLALYYVARLPLQLLFIAWAALWSTREASPQVERDDDNRRQAGRRSAHEAGTDSAGAKTSGGLNA